MRVGLVGAGGMTQITHLSSLLQIADVELVAVAELDRARAEAFEKSPENQMRQAVNELQIRMYRKSLGLPLDPAKPPAVAKSKQ